MSFYKKLQEGKDSDYSLDDNLEEQYQKMFKKIARDFIHVDDFKDIMRNVLVEILNAPDGLDQKTFAYLKAKEYEANLNKKISDRQRYLDVDELFIGKDNNDE